MGWLRSLKAARSTGILQQCCTAAKPAPRQQRRLLCLPAGRGVLLQVWLPAMPSITGANEDKLVAVATARMLSEAKQLAAPDAAELDGRLLAALVGCLEGGGARGGEEAAEEGGGEEEHAAAGYSAAYARLHNAYK